MSKNASQAPTPVNTILLRPAHKPLPGVSFQRLRKRLEASGKCVLHAIMQAPNARLYFYLCPTGFAIVADHGNDDAEVYRLMGAECADELADRLLGLGAKPDPQADNDFDGDHANEDQKTAFPRSRAAIVDAMVNAARGPHMAPLAPAFNPQDEDGLPVINPAMTDEELEEKYNEALGHGRH